MQKRINSDPYEQHVVIKHHHVHLEVEVTGALETQDLVHHVNHKQYAYEHLQGDKREFL